MMAANPLYQNKLTDLLTGANGGYQASPGYQFALDQGIQAAQRSNSAMRNSGATMAALTKYGAGLAAQDYGNTRDFLGRMTGQEQQYGLGQEQNANNRQTADQNFGLGMYRAGNDFALGQAQNANNWFSNNTNWFNAQSQDRARTAGTNQNWWDRLGG
jgi:hypothetical protein